MARRCNPKVRVLINPDGQTYTGEVTCGNTTCPKKGRTNGEECWVIAQFGGGIGGKSPHTHDRNHLRKWAQERGNETAGRFADDCTFNA